METPEQPDGDRRLRVRIQLDAPINMLMQGLQRHLDVLRVLEAGLAGVQEAQVSDMFRFMTFSPSENTRLGHEAAKASAQQWISRSFFRDAMETAGLFLDEALLACESIRLVTEGKLSNSVEFKKFLDTAPARLHKLHFPAKIERLRSDFELVPAWSAEALSLNRARTCLVHRLGSVTPLDADDEGKLQLRFLTLEMFAVLPGGEELLLDRTNVFLPGVTTVNARFVQRQREFSVGDQLDLTATDLFDCIVTLWRFGKEVMNSVAGYATARGLPPAKPEAA